MREPVTKIGGQPVWLEEPAWPVSAELETPMRFLGQFALDGGRLAYLFMTADEEEYVDDTWEPDAGENALVIQPGGRIPEFVEVEALAEGPTYGPDHLPVTGTGKWPDQFLGGPKIKPYWLQRDETPGKGWQLVVQLSHGMPFEPNFGDAGTGYAFVSPDGKEGRFLWQCH
ncbi:YwqG family protein [Actinomadura sp. CNU-125]|uniref:YwqG family protein n=1 Tax=Actinomadura sp. CNU-125 TaxID=1904961 RepID=UPI0021CCE42B|nr:YwqG family protein [Actinomadura sp. CNU-125]